MTTLTLSQFQSHLDTSLEELKLALMLLPGDSNSAEQLGPAAVMQLLLFDFLRQSSWEVERIAVLLRHYGLDIGEYSETLDTQLEEANNTGTGKLRLMFLEIMNNRYVTLTEPGEWRPLLDLTEDSMLLAPPPVPPVYALSVSLGILYISVVGSIEYPEVHRRLLNGTLFAGTDAGELPESSAPSSSSSDSAAATDSSESEDPASVSEGTA